MFCQLGNIQFDGLFGPVALEQSGGAVYAEHELINTKGRLQFTGIKLEEWNFDLRLHVDFCKPVESAGQLWDYMTSAEVLKFISGTGELLGNVVITDLFKTYEDMLPDGAIRSMYLRIALKEYFISDKLAAMQANKSDNAPGISRTGLVGAPLQTTNSKTISKSVSIDVTQMNASAARINDLVNKPTELNVKDKASLITNVKNFEQSAKSTVEKIGNAANKYSNQVNNGVTFLHNQVKGVFDEYNELQNTVNRAVNASGRLLNALDAPNDFLRGINQELQGNLDIANRILQPVRSSKILRGDVL